MTRRNLNDEDREMAALFVLGCLTGEDKTNFRQSLANSSALRDEVVSLQSAVEFLGDLPPKVEPPSHLKAKVLETVAAENREPATVSAPPIWKQWKSWLESEQHEDVLIRADDGWEQTPVEGVFMKKLYINRVEDRVCLLVRMSPGSVYPAHIHNGPEECYVLEGDVQAEGLSLGRGDYQRKNQGTSHGPQYTNGGCMLLITSSLRDEFVSRAH